MIRIRRTAHQFTDRLRSYEVALDGNIVGRVNAGEVVEYNTSPGEHTLQLKIDWCGSPTLDFAIADDEVIDFECGGLSGYKLLLAPPITILQKNRYLWVERVGTRNISDLPLLNNRSSTGRNLVQAGQKWKFVFRYGVLGWGITAGILFQMFRLITGVKNSPVDWVINLGLFMVGGLCWGLIMWAVLRKREPI